MSAGGVCEDIQTYWMHSRWDLNRCQETHYKQCEGLSSLINISSALGSLQPENCPCKKIHF